MHCCFIQLSLPRFSFFLISVATLKKSKTLDGPLKKPQKTPGQISMQLAYILGKNPTFPGINPIFPKKCLFSAKISDDLFLVINSDFQIFTLLQLIPYFFSKSTWFQQKTLENTYFPGKLKKPTKTLRLLKTPDKTQGLCENSSEPTVGSKKNPDLGRKA